MRVCCCRIEVWLVVWMRLLQKVRKRLGLLCSLWRHAKSYAEACLVTT